MKLKVLVTAAAIPALATVALAQTTTTPTPTPGAAPTTTTTTTPTPDATAAPQWYQHQQGEWRSSKLVGTKVKNTAGDTVGDINEIVLTRDGSASAAIIGVGGFLGIGEREVAVDFKSLHITRDSGGHDVVTLNTTKEALKNAPAWTWQSS